MKNIYKSLFILSVAAVSFASCAKQEDNQYTPAEKETGTTYYFSVETAGSYPVANDEVTKISVPVLRSTDTEDASIKVAVTDTSKIFFSQGSAEIPVAFAKGEKKANIEIPVDFSVLSQDFGHEYGVTLEITENTSQYALSNYTIKIFAPEPWTSLGYGVWSDAWLFEDTFEKVEFFQNDLNPNLFKIGWSAAICENYSDENPDDWPEFFTFEILNVGDKIGDVTITQPGLVYYDIFNTGMYVSSYSDYISIVHCSAFSSMQNEAMFAKNKVVAYQEPDENGKILPAVIELAPAYYMLDYNAGWGSQANNVNMVLTFPGVEIKDYTIELEYEGILTDKDGIDNALVDIAFTGADVTDVAVVMVEGKDPNAGIALIDPEEGEQDASVVTISAAGQLKIPFAEDAEDGFYTVVAVPVDVNGEYNWDYAVFETFSYGNVDPLYLEYTSEDFTAPVSKDELIGTTWIAYAAGYGKTVSDRVPCAYVKFADAEDVADDVDLVSCSGLANSSAFEDTFNIEWYNGVLYMLGGAQTGTWNSYDVYAMSYSDAAFGTSDYTMCGAYVGDGIIAMTNNSKSDNYYGIGFWAVADGEVAGYLAAREYLLLVNPAILEEASGAPAKRNVSSLTPKKNLVEVNTFSTRNDITFNQRDWSKDVVASGKVTSFATSKKFENPRTEM